MTGAEARHRPHRPALEVAILATGALVVAAVVTRMLRPPVATDADVTRTLLAVAALLLAVLTASRRPAIAWAAASIAALLSVQEPVALARALEGDAGDAVTAPTPDRRPGRCRRRVRLSWISTGDQIAAIISDVGKSL